VKTSITLLTAGVVFGFFLLCGCETSPKTKEKRESLVDEAQAAVNRFQREDPSLKDFMSKAYGYAIFPDVGKGGLVVGGSYGKGVVYQQGKLVGYADLTQATVGAQIGGETFSELITFETADAINKFKDNQLAFTAQASAVAIKSGAAATAKYDNGVAVFTMTKGGLMAEAALGGQKFTYRPASDYSGTTP
jgi:lipid-binding SYLF domain-containing protein